MSKSDSQSSGAPLAPGAKLAHYEIIRTLGAGGMGQVYLATDTKLHREVALKFLPDAVRHDPEARERLLREARATSRLNHKNIVTVHSVEHVDDYDFIVMEYIDGKPLNELIASRTLTARQIVRIALHLADGLSSAHEQGIIHRDIKPGNIFLTSKDQIKIMDFGLATWRGAAKLTRDGSTVGTMAYISPEQARGEAVDPRSDLFSYGAVLYEMATGRTPFTGDHEAALLYAIVNEEPEPLVDPMVGLPSGFAEIIARLLKKNPRDRYQSAEDVIVDLKREKMSTFSSVTPDPSQVSVPRVPRQSKVPRFVVPALIVAALAVVLLVLKPWSVDVSPTQEAEASDDLLAVMYFENFADPGDSKRLGEIAANLLITDLSQSRYMKVVSSQRLFDILKNLGMEDTKVIDREVATQVARKAGARWMLTGSILQIEPQLQITTQLIDVNNGNVITSQRASGARGQTIFDLVDDLTVAIKTDLSLPDAALAESDPSVSDITSRSWDAYSYYIEGMDNFYRYKWFDSEGSFRKAIELDSTFAMAWYGLSLARSVSTRDQITAIDEAVEHIDRVSAREQDYIRARYANLHGDYARAIEILEGIADRYPDDKEAHMRLARIYQRFRDRSKTKRALHDAIACDSMFKEAYNVLAYSYIAERQSDSAVWAVSKYLDMAPDEPNPYDSRGDMYGYEGRLDDAMRMYQQALDVDPDYLGSRLKLVIGHLLRREFEAAERDAQFLLDSPNKNIRSAGRNATSWIPAMQGQFGEALRRFEYGLETDRVERISPIRRVFKLSLRSSVYEALGDLDAALKDAENARDLIVESEPSYYVKYMWLLRVPELMAKKGDTVDARALVDQIEAQFAQGDSANVGSYLFGMGLAYLALGETDRAIAYLKEADSLYVVFASKYTLARALYAAGRLGDAVERFEEAEVIFDDSRQGRVTWSVLTHYYLGRAYEDSGWKDKALAQYNEFLGFWGNADRETAEIADARVRLKTLTGGAF